MTDQQARAKFERLCKELHEAGWDVLCAISKAAPGGTDTVQRALLHGGDAEAQAHAFLRCNRAFKDGLERAADAALRGIPCEPTPPAPFVNVNGSALPRTSAEGAR